MTNANNIKTRLQDETFLNDVVLPACTMFVGAILTLWCTCVIFIGFFEMLINALLPTSGLVVGILLISWACDALHLIEKEDECDDDQSEEENEE